LNRLIDAAVTLATDLMTIDCAEDW